MLLDSMHPEDVKAVIRKRHGTISAFLAEKNLPATGVADLFRGRKSEPVRQAVEQLLKEAAAQSIDLDGSKGPAGAHRLNAGAR